MARRELLTSWLPYAGFVFDTFNSVLVQFIQSLSNY